MANKYVKKCLTFLTIQEMQIKMTLWFHLTTVRMAITKKTSNNKCWCVCGGGHFTYWECKLVQSLWKLIWRFLKKLKRELPHDPATTLLDIIWRNLSQYAIEIFVHFFF
jgi:hypothetical protein